MLFCGLFVTLSAQDYTFSTKHMQRLASPDGKLVVMIDFVPGSNLHYSVYTDEETGPFIKRSDISMELGDGTVLGRNLKVTKTERKSVNQDVRANFYKKAIIHDQYNELSISFKGNYQVVFRAYNSGIAYRFVTKMKDSIIVTHETAEFNFSDGMPAEFESDRFTQTEAFVPYVNRKAAENGDFVPRERIQ